MTDQEQADAAIALMRWFESQSIKPKYAVLVMVLAICSIIKSRGNSNIMSAHEGAQIVANMITDNIEDSHGRA